jgi:hypothetical protein
VRFIQPSTDFITVSGNVGVIFAGGTNCWKELFPLFVSKLGNVKINIYAVTFRMGICRLQ